MMTDDTQKSLSALTENEVVAASRALHRVLMRTGLTADVANAVITWLNASDPMNFALNHAISAAATGLLTRETYEALIAKMEAANNAYKSFIRQLAMQAEADEERMPAGVVSHAVPLGQAQYDALVERVRNGEISLNSTKLPTGATLPQDEVAEPVTDEAAEKRSYERPLPNVCVTSENHMLGFCVEESGDRILGAAELRAFRDSFDEIIKVAEEMAANSKGEWQVKY